jgi:hypothetical protein
MVEQIVIGEKTGMEALNGGRMENRRCPVNRFAGIDKRPKSFVCYPKGCKITSKKCPGGKHG